MSGDDIFGKLAEDAEREAAAIPQRKRKPKEQERVGGAYPDFKSLKPIDPDEEPMTLERLDAILAEDEHGDN